VGKGAKLEIYSEEGLKGAKADFYPGTYGKLPCGWNDKVKSARAIKFDNNPVVMFYMHDDFDKPDLKRERQGLSVGLWSGKNDGIVCDNEITQIVVPKGIEVTIYEHYDRFGKSKVLKEGDHNLIAMGWDNMVSSIAIYTAGQSNAFDKGLPENASDLARKYAVLFDFDDDCCYPSPALYEGRGINPGLQDKDDADGCREKHQLENANTYCRVRTLEYEGDTYQFIMYALYFPKDPAETGGHRNDWEWAGVWLKNGKLEYASYSAHGDAGDTKRIDDLFTDDKNHVKVVYHKEALFTRSMRFAHEDELKSREWTTPALVEWDLMSQEDKDLLENYNFGSAHFPLEDGNFFKLIGQYDPGINKGFWYTFGDYWEDKQKLWQENSYSNNPAFYTDTKYNGKAMELSPGEYNLTSGYYASYNDEISSVRIPAGYEVTVYADSYYSGQEKDFGKNVSSLVGIFNDEISSIKIEKEARVTLYTDTKYNGRAIELSAGEYNLTSGYYASFNDVISSIKIPAGYRVKVYTDSYYKGEKEIFDKDISSLVGKFNDKISSIKIEKR
jgi:hypothetical protein